MNREDDKTTTQIQTQAYITICLGLESIVRINKHLHKADRLPTMLQNE